VDYAGALTVIDWLKAQIEAKLYWFHRMESRHCEIDYTP
jgi:hypothetical protein